MKPNTKVEWAGSARARRAEVAMEEKQETPESDEEELDFDQDALDRWQDDGGRAVIY